MMKSELALAVPIRAPENNSEPSDDPQVSDNPSSASERKTLKTFGHLRDAEDDRTSPLTAMRRFCMECLGNSAREVERCTAFKCHLWEFRFGQRPHTSRAKKPLLMNPEYVKTLHPTIYPNHKFESNATNVDAK